MPETPAPGDKIVELAAVVQSAAVLTGLVAAPWIAWSIASSWPVCAAAAAAGVAVALAVARYARMRYRAPDGRTAVVKAGAGALKAAVPAALRGAIPTAVFIALGSNLLPGPKIPGAILAVALRLGAGLGILAALLACML